MSEIIESKKEWIVVVEDNDNNTWLLSKFNKEEDCLKYLCFIDDVGDHGRDLTYRVFNDSCTTYQEAREEAIEYFDLVVE